jgi:DNA-binding CsgD family transcriptional regulator
MKENQHSITGKFNDDDPVLEEPRVSLLNAKQWLYIRKRYHMSPRELHVAKLVCEGFPNKEIAKALKIKPGTVKTHMRNIYRRVRIKRKIEMLLKFVDDATKFSNNSGTIPPIPIVEVKEKSEKHVVSVEVSKLEEKSTTSGYT